ncbi:638_t:CDS:2, partial [Dentiscutata erythropus]
MPQKYIDIMMQALEFEPNNRPTICNMFKGLYDIVNNPENAQQSHVKSSKRDFSQSSFLSVENAMNEAKKPDGDKQKALGYINIFSELGDPKASYYKGYFLQQKLYSRILFDQYEKIPKVQKDIASLF